MRSDYIKKRMNIEQSHIYISLFKYLRPTTLLVSKCLRRIKLPCLGPDLVDTHQGHE